VRRSEHSGFAAKRRSSAHKSRSSHKTGEPATQEHDRPTQSRGTRFRRCPGHQCASSARASRAP
jgi:hypothetical protein